MPDILVCLVPVEMGWSFYMSTTEQSSFSYLPTLGAMYYQLAMLSAILPEWEGTWTQTLSLAIFIGGQEFPKQCCGSGDLALMCFVKEAQHVSFCCRGVD